jgi:DNA-binding CsgD family transcriptional regulator
MIGLWLITLLGGRCRVSCSDRPTGKFMTSFRKGGEAANGQVSRVSGRASAAPRHEPVLSGSPPIDPPESLNAFSSEAEASPIVGGGYLPVIDEDAVELYRLVAKQGYLNLNEILEVGERLDAEGGNNAAGAGRLSECVGVLLALRLLKRAPGSPEILLPVSPETAEAELLPPLNLDITRRQQAIELLRGQFLAMASAYDECRKEGPANREIERFETLCAMRARFGQAALSCERTAVIAYGGRPPTAERLAMALPWELGMLERGVRLRILLPHSARNHLALRHYVNDISATGGDFRTSAHHWDLDIALFDKKMILISDFSMAPGPSAGGGLALGNPTLLHILGSMLDWAWAEGVPLLGDQGDDEHAVAGEVKRSVARLLEMGLKDEAVARRLGMSLRTCRKRIAELMDELDSTSRFQAGAQAVRRGLLS